MCSPLRLLRLFSCLFVILLSPQISRAQRGAELLFIEVRDANGRAIAGATVRATRGPDRFTIADSTRENGSVSISFADGTGDYLVFVTALGFQSVRRRVQLDGSATIRQLFVLSEARPELDVVRVRASRSIPPSVTRPSLEPSPGEAMGLVDEFRGLNPVEASGAISEFAVGAPAFVGAGDGLSVLGLGPTQNAVNLDGMSAGIGRLPRGARTETVLSTASFDATLPGSVGGLVDVRIAKGSRQLFSRGLTFTASSRAASGTAALGDLSPLLLNGSIAADGEVVRDKVTFNGALQFSTDVPSVTPFLAKPVLVNGKAVSSQQLSELNRALSDIPIPTGSPRSFWPSANRTASALGRFDLVGDSTSERSLVLLGEWSALPSRSSLRLSSPAADATVTSSSLGVQASYARWFGPGRENLVRARSMIALHRQAFATKSIFPAVQLDWVAELEDQTATRATVLVGNASAPDNVRTSGQLSTSLEYSGSHSAGTRRTRVRFDADVDGVSTQYGSEPYRELVFQSPSAIQSLRPDRFVSTRRSPLSSPLVAHATIAASHEWSVAERLRIITGLRGQFERVHDAVRIMKLGSRETRIGMLPQQLSWSPRAGFTYTYSRRNTRPSATVNGLGTFYQSSSGYVRGGIGHFLGQRSGASLAEVRATSEESIVTTDACYAPLLAPNEWSDLLTGLPESICLDGLNQQLLSTRGTAGVEQAFRAPSNVKTSLGWGHRARIATLSVDLDAAFTRNLPDRFDVNARTQPQLRIPHEAFRPLFIPSTSISSDGAVVDPRASRIDPAFAERTMLQSTLAARALGATVTITPRLWRLGGSSFLYTSLSATRLVAHTQFRDYATASDDGSIPLRWAPSAFDVRYNAVGRIGLLLPKWFNVNAILRAQSGRPYTPLVARDIDGDGRALDRAYIAPDGEVGDDLAESMPRMPREASRCLQQQSGTIAAMHACRSRAWFTADLVLSPRGSFSILGRPSRLSVAFRNVPAALDLLFHGARSARGWGTMPRPDQILLVPTRFDQASARYSYVVNGNFGKNLAGGAPNVLPMLVTLDLSMDLSTALPVQQLRRALRTGTPANGNRSDSIAKIASTLLLETSDPFRFVLSESDSLFLSSSQRQQLLRADSSYTLAVRSLYGRASGRVHDARARAGAAEVKIVEDANAEYLLVFWRQLEVLTAILRPDQFSLLRELVDMQRTAPPNRPSSRFNLGFPVRW